MYAAEDLKGLIVEHKMEEFVEGKNVVLTLKDAGGRSLYMYIRMYMPSIFDHQNKKCNSN